MKEFLERLNERLDIFNMVLDNMYENEQIKSVYYQELKDQLSRLKELVSNLYGNETNIS